VRNSVDSNVGWFMQCTSCHSVNLAEFTAEMVIHFRGLRNLDHAGLPTFPELSVCLSCGSAQFVVPEGELGLLADRIAANDASASVKLKAA
jgi:hypothetical protein